MFFLFAFREWKKKFDLERVKENDTLKYHFSNTLIFRPDLSNGLTGNEIITMPHPLMAPLIFAVNVDRKSLLELIGQACDVIFGEPKSMFWTGRVWDILFDGISLDCSDEDSFQAAAVCEEFQNGASNAVKPFNDTHFEFALMKNVGFETIFILFNFKFSIYVLVIIA